MKKFLSLGLIFCLIVPCMFMLSACSHEHTFETKWTFNDTHHWHASTCEHGEEKKDYAEHVGTEDGICDVCRHGVVALIGNVEYIDLEEAIKEVEEGEEIVLFDNIDLQTAIEISRKVTIDLNGKKLSVSQDTAGDGVFHVLEGGDLTINGEGIVDGVGNNKWNIVIFVEGGDLTINGGLYTNTGLTVDPEDTDSDHFDVIYVKGGNVEINGGTFEGYTPDWLLNMNDNSRETSTIEVKGGTFHGFNPENNETEGANTNYVAEGYTVQENNGVYTVVAE